MTEIKNKVLTLCLIHTDTQVLLGKKKRGFGEGKWNGFGGKVEMGETIEEAARREVLEESGLTIPSIEKRGIVHFAFEDNPEILEVHIFGTREFSGDPIETEEMFPQWFLHDEIPFDSMWPDDKHWFPAFFRGVKFTGRFHFGAQNELLHGGIEEVTELP